MTALSAVEAARLRYIAEYPHFERAAAALRTRLASVLREQALADAGLKVRAKEVSSFVKKLRKYGDECWDRTTDKVGAQITTHTLAEVRQLRRLLEAGVDGLEYLSTTDKSMYNGDPRELRYTGVHIQVRLTEVTTSDDEPIECEIQLRTQAQDVWAYLEHGLIYKPMLAPSVKIARKVARLSVLVEMFDEEVDVVMDQLQQDPRYGSALLLREAERWYLTFSSAPGEAELSLEVLDQISDSFDAQETVGYRHTLAAFVTDHRGRIEDALRDYGAGTTYAGEFAYVLFSQPEALILWERMEHKPLALARTLRGTELFPAVEALADVWGHSLSTS